MPKRIKRYGIRTIHQRVFSCQVCKTHVTAPKTHGTTNPGHIKTMWCYICQKTTDHIQIE